MKNFGIVCAALALVVCLVGSASAADRALSIPASTLSSMGLGGVHQMSDTAGLSIRGMGGNSGTMASVWGSGTAVKGDNNSSNGYSASASHKHGDASASGANLSFAGKASGALGDFYFKVNVAGGSSSAMAH